MIPNLNGWARCARATLLPILLVFAQAFGCRLAPAQPAVYDFVHISGRISPGSADGTNGDARFWLPEGIAADPAGNLFVTDAENGTVREITKTGTNWITRTLAGVAGSLGSADGTNTDARFGWPSGIAADRNGNLFAADTQNFTIRMLTRVGTNWVVRTIAGLAGAAGTADGTNQDIRFTVPTSVAVDTDGNLFIADYHFLRKLMPVGNDWVSSTLTITNFTVEHFNCVSVDTPGALYVAGSYDVGNDAPHTVLARLEQTGTNWAGVELPSPPFDNRGLFQITAGTNKTAFVSSWRYQVIWQVAWTGSNWVWSSVAGTPWVTGSVDGTNSDALFNGPVGMVVMTNGNLFVCDEANNTVRDIALVGTDWVTTTIAGLPPNPVSADGTNDLALFSQPFGLAVDSTGTVYTADSGAHAIRLTRNVGGDWVTQTIAGLLGQSGSADGANSDARLNFPAGIVASPTGVLYIVDSGNNTIRKLEPIGSDWITTTIAGLAGSTNWQDGTNTDIRFQGPWGIAMDSWGSLYVTERSHGSIRKLMQIGTNWVSSTLATGAGPLMILPPSDVAVGADGTIYFADEFGRLDQLQPVGASWVLNIVSSEPVFGSIALDHNGSFFFTGYGVQELVRVGTNWVSRTLGGPFSPIDFSGSIPVLQALALGPHGDLYVADGNALWLGIRRPVAATAPVVQAPVLSNGVVTCSWTSTPGLAYQLQSCSDLSAAAWTNLGNPLVATNGIVATTDAAASNTQRFYRVVLLP